MKTQWSNHLAVQFPDRSLSVQPIRLSEDEATRRALAERDSWNRVNTKPARAVHVTLAVVETEVE